MQRNPARAGTQGFALKRRTARERSRRAAAGSPKADGGPGASQPRPSRRGRPALRSVDVGGGMPGVGFGRARARPAGIRGVVASREPAGVARAPSALDPAMVWAPAAHGRERLSLNPAYRPVFSQ